MLDGIERRAALVGMAVFSIGVVSCGRGDTPEKGAVAAAFTDSASRADTVESGGEVVPDSAVSTVPGKWIDDGNVVSMLSMLNGAVMNGARMEMQRYTNDTLRLLAEDMLRQHASAQRSIDSVAGKGKITPAMPALGLSLQSDLQTQVSRVEQASMKSLGAAFVEQQISAHEALVSYLPKLASVVEDPDLGAVISASVTREKGHLERAKGVKVAMAAADSAKAAADSAKAAAKRARSSGRR